MQMMNEEQCRAMLQDERWRYFLAACVAVIVFNVVVYLLSGRYAWARKLWTGR